MMAFDERAQELVTAGMQLYQWGMVPATSGNFSARINHEEIAITVSGRHKGKLEIDDIMRINLQGESLDGKKSSAETGLHTQIYRRFNAIHAVLHVHSISSILLSREVGNELMISDHELLKAFPGINTHDTSVTIPVFDNEQDIASLARKVDSQMDGDNHFPAYLIRGHGLYSWGETVSDVMNYIEALDFLFQCEWAERVRANL